MLYALSNYKVSYSNTTIFWFDVLFKEPNEKYNPQFPKGLKYVDFWERVGIKFHLQISDELLGSNKGMSCNIHKQTKKRITSIHQYLKTKMTTK